MAGSMSLGSRPTRAAAAAFVAIGLAIHAVLFAGAEWLVHRNGHMNPVFKVEASAEPVDWVILGASHAMPLDFDGAEAEMEAATGLRILNLAGPGTGPLYNRFVLEHFLRGRRTQNVLYVVDAFAFRSAQWNEERFSDPGLLARTPLSLSLLVGLSRYVRDDGVDPRALVDYATGFSKLNDRDRFEADRWDGEAQFDRVFRPSASADRKRVDYLYPAVADETAQQARYLADLATLIAQARAAGATVSLTRFPLPARFKALLPGEAEFDRRLAALAAGQGVAVHDFSAAVQGSEFYADTDHLNRAGVRSLFDGHLRDVLLRPDGPGA